MLANFPLAEAKTCTTHSSAGLPRRIPSQALANTFSVFMASQVAALVLQSLRTTWYSVFFVDASGFFQVSTFQAHVLLTACLLQHVAASEPLLCIPCITKSLAETRSP